MSKISQELKVLLYLNQRYSRPRWVTIKEIADYLEVSDRQARRYLEDLNAIPEINIETKLQMIRKWNPAIHERNNTK